MQSTSSKSAIVCSGRSELTFALCESPSVSMKTRRGALFAHFGTKGPVTRIPFTSGVSSLPQERTEIPEKKRTDRRNSSRSFAEQSSRHATGQPVDDLSKDPFV